MLKLTVISGPNRGATFALSPGQNGVGRQQGSNVVVLNSAKVSKRHCVLVVNGDDSQGFAVTVEDQGSSNGTFVNGALARKRDVKPGDRISVGEFVLELVAPKSTSKVSSALPVMLDMPGQNNVIRFPGGQNGVRLPDLSGADGLSGSGPRSRSGSGISTGALSGDPMAMGAPMPNDLKGKVLWHFENHLMPIFYQLLLKSEWRVVCLTLFAALTLANLVVSVQPLLDAQRESLVRESGKRARFMARQIAEQNGPFLAAHAETKAEVSSSIESADGVRIAVLADLDSRIIAPGTRLNQYLTGGKEALAAVRARDAFRKGRETGTIEHFGELIVAVEPVKTYSQDLGRNVVSGMAVVSIDASQSTPDLGEMGMVYSEALILTGLFGALVMLVLYRLTLRPFQVLSDDLDKVLKGELVQVSRDYKLQEMDPLWDLVNSAVQRMGRADASSPFGAGLPVDLSPGIEELSAPIRLIGDALKAGVMVCDADRKIVQINEIFEEISGIRAENAAGQDISSVARDQSLVMLVNDLLDRAPSAGSQGVVEDYDFSGIGYKVYASVLGASASGGGHKGYVLTAVRTGE